MDPVTVLGTVSAVATIVQVIGKTIKSLRGLHDKWEDADFTIINLMAQLTALKAALNKISDWLSSDLANIAQHHQLVIDLHDVIACCQTLVCSMDKKISSLDWNLDNTLDLGSKIRVIFNDKASNNFQKFIKRQTSALTLLLTACNCKTLSEQKKMLEEHVSRELLDQVKDDSSSLLVLCDSASYLSRRTQSTGRSSKWSIEFHFDSVLLGSRVYQRAVRSMFKRPSQPWRVNEVATASPRLAKSMATDARALESKSLDIDKALRQDKELKCREVGILALCKSKRDKDVILDQFIQLEGDYSTEQRLSFKEKILTFVFDNVQNMCQEISDRGFVAASSVEDEINVVLSQHLPLDRVPEELAIAVQKVCTYVEKLPLHERPEIAHNPRDFSMMSRVVQLDYVPTCEDVVEYQDSQNPTSFDVTFDIGQLRYRLINFAGQNIDRRKLMHQFDHVHILLSAVDLCSFTEAAEAGVSDLIDNLNYFDSVVNSRWLITKPVILLLYNQDALGEKLRKMPFHHYFPDYQGDNSVEKVCGYIYHLFENRVRGDRDFYRHLDDISSRFSILKSVQDIIIQRSLKNLE